MTRDFDLTSQPGVHLPDLGVVPRVLRHEVPVDGEQHTLRLSGAVLHVDSRRPDVVELWSFYSGGPLVGRAFQAFGTGQRLPEWASPDRHRGSVIGAGGALVWHLFEVPA